MFDLHGYGPTIAEGAWLTLEVALVSVLISIVLGMAGALARLSKSPVARGIATTYTTLIRGVPDLVLMLLLFFGGQLLLNWIGDLLELEEQIDLSPFTAGVLTIGFIFGAYMAETFRGAMMAVPRGQLEAGHAYGMSGLQVFVRIMLPQMIRYALPGFGNNWLVLLKTTALVSVIGLNDMVNKARFGANATKQPFTFYLMVCLGYLAFTTVSLLLLRWAERRYSLGYERGGR